MMLARTGACIRLAAWMLAVACLAVPMTAFGGGTVLVSVGPGGVAGDGASSMPFVSGDGRFVVFGSASSNLVGGDTNGYFDIFVRDLQTGATERVSVASDGTQADRESWDPSISSDGRYVAFNSDAGDLVPGVSPGVPKVVVHDRQTGATELVPVGPDGSLPNQETDTGRISRDGRYVAFSTWATNWGPSPAHCQVHVRDRVAGLTELVSADAGGQPGNGDSWDWCISGDGRYVVIESQATSLGGSWFASGGQLLRKDMQTGAIDLVSRADNGTPGNARSHIASITSDGRYVAINSYSTNLVPGDTNGAVDAFVRDMVGGVITLVSLAADGSRGNARSAPEVSSISDDGKYVVFESLASNLVPGDTNGTQDIFVRDLSSNALQRVSLAPDGPESNGGSSGSAISEDGRYVAFASNATNLVGADTHGHYQIYIRYLPPRAPITLSIYASSAVVGGSTTLACVATVAVSQCPVAS